MYRIVFFLLFSSTVSFANDWSPLLSSKVFNSVEFQLSTADMTQFGGSRQSSPAFETAISNSLLRLPSFAQIHSKIILSQKNDLSKLLVFTLSQSGWGVRRDLLGDPLKKNRRISQKSKSFESSLRKLFRQYNKPFQMSKMQSQQLKAVPLELQQLASFLIEVSLQNIRWQKKAYKKITLKTSKILQKQLLESANHSSDSESSVSHQWEFAAENTDFHYMATGAVELSMVIEEVFEKLRVMNAEKKFSFQIETPIGSLILNGAGEDNQYRGPIFLSIDLSGDDTYVQASSTSLSRPLSIIFDLKGNDNYLAAPDFAKGRIAQNSSRKNLKIQPDIAAAFFGNSVLVDIEGNDRYSAKSYSVASGVFGVGILWDFQGNDRYDCYSYCQSNALFGASLLIDSNGQDQYSGFQAIQSYSGTKGSSLLLDIGRGKDQYIAYTDPIDFPSSIDKTVNESRAQAVSFGHRADYVDGHSWSGGVAHLVDDGGDNQFEAGFFTQGFSYWYGMGVLLVGPGNDTYKASKYAQGSATHFGVGVLLDVGGDDKYSVDQELGLGVGHDFSYGALIDLNGSDTYSAANLSIGCGSANGMGLFFDNGGDDTYILQQQAHVIDFMGCAIDRVGRYSLRNRNHTIGLHIDAGGKNRLSSIVGSKNGQHRSKTLVHRPAKVFPLQSDRFYHGGGFFLRQPLATFADDVMITDWTEFFSSN